MAKYCAIYSLSYINDENGINVINNSKEEVWEEYNIACFNGLAYFKSFNGTPYIMQYPKLQKLGEEEKALIERHCGYIPEAKEYGAICSTFGRPKKVTEKQFKEVMRDYPIKTSDRQYFPWLKR